MFTFQTVAVGFFSVQYLISQEAVDIGVLNIQKQANIEVTFPWSAYRLLEANASWSPKSAMDRQLAQWTVMRWCFIFRRWMRKQKQRATSKYEIRSTSETHLLICVIEKQQNENVHTERLSTRAKMNNSMQEDSNTYKHARTNAYHATTTYTSGSRNQTRVRTHS